MARSPRGGVAALPAAVLLAQWRLSLGNKSLPAAPILIDREHGGSCVWPNCTKQKVSCQAKKVGTCVMPSPGCDNKNAVCTLGRCNCPEFYCAVPGTKECVPQFTYEGARPSGYDRGPWLRVFTALGSPDQYPTLSQLVDRPIGLITARCIPAVLLLFVGLAVAVYTGLDLCEDLVRCVCCKRPLRPALTESDGQDELVGAPVKDSQDELVGAPVKDNLTLVGLEWVDTEAPHRHKKEKEPSCGPVTALAVLVVLLSISAVIGRVINWSITRNILIQVLDRFKGNAEMLSGESVVLNYTASNLSSTFTQVAQCNDNPLMSMLGGLAVSSALELASAVHDFKTHVERVPDYVDSIEKDIDDAEALAVYLPCAPMIIMSLIAAGMLAEVLFTRYYGSSKTAKYEDKGLAVCAGVFVLMIVVVAATSAALLSGVIGVAQLCDEIDTNLVNYVQHAAQLEHMDDIAVNISRHYLHGDVFNPLAGFADDIYINVETVVELVDEYNQSLIHPQSLSCKPLNDLHVEQVGKVTKSTLSIARDLFNATNIYPYYHEVVHEGLCNHMAGSLGLFLIQQAVVGLIFFPLCACWTHNYLAHHLSAQQSGLVGDSTDDDYTEGDTEDADAGPLKPTVVAPREVQR